MDFQSEAYSSIISTIISGITGIALAYLGYGVWSLALYMVLQTFLKSVLLWLQSDWRPKGWISLESIKKYFKFGSNLLILGLVDKTVSNLESLLIGRVYSKSDLGYFSQARNLDSQFIQTSTIIIQSVSYPALSRIKDDKEKLKYGYKKVLKMAMFFAIPITAFIIVGSENIISVIYGQKWLPAAPYLSIWAVLGLFVSMHSIFTNIFLVLGQSRLYLKVSLLRQILRVITILLFINTSIINLLYAITITSTMFAFVYVFIGGRMISYKITEVFYDLKNIFFSSLLSGSSVYLLNYFVPDNNIFGFISKLVLMSVTYIIVLFALKDDSYIEIKGLVFNQIRRLKKN
jgi:O-antigen/teichoic acid export membrane protein